MLTIWLGKDIEVADKTTGGPPALPLVAKNPASKIAAKANPDRLKDEVVEVRCAEKTKDKAARKFFTAQPTDKPPISCSIRLQEELKVEAESGAQNFIDRRQWRM